MEPTDCFTAGRISYTQIHFFVKLGAVIIVKKNKDGDTETVFFFTIPLNLLNPRLCGVVGPASILLSGSRTQLSEEEDGVAAVDCSAGDVHRHLEPRQEEGTTSRWV